MRRTALVFCDDCPRRSSCETPEDVCDVVRLVDRTTRAQGLPFAVEDPVVLQQVVTLLGLDRPMKSPGGADSA